ncbi:hypothetical protein ACHAXS_003634 [Conticribra weissflogii]
MMTRRLTALFLLTTCVVGDNVHVEDDAAVEKVTPDELEIKSKQQVSIISNEYQVKWISTLNKCNFLTSVSFNVVFYTGFNSSQSLSLQEFQEIQMR